MPHYDLLVVGAGPAGISTAIEARAAGVPSSAIVVLEKGPEHSYAIRRFYPDGKRVDAVYKGLEVPCEGQLCISDGSKQQTRIALSTIISSPRSGVRPSWPGRRVL